MFHIQLYNITVMVSIPSPPYFIPGKCIHDLVCPCCLSVVQFSYKLYFSPCELSVTLLNHCLLPRRRFSSRILRRTFCWLWAFLACGHDLLDSSLFPAEVVTILPFCVLNVAIFAAFASPACLPSIPLISTHICFIPHQNLVCFMNYAFPYFSSVPYLSSDIIFLPSSRSFTLSRLYLACASLL